MSVKTRREENAEATRDALIQQASLLFAESGFNNTSLSKVAELTRVTKGAVYHHFESKEDIFSACYRKQANAVAATIRKVKLSGDSWLDTIKQCEVYLDCALTGDDVGIPIQEAITVLGWTRWRKLDEECTMGLLIQTIDNLKAEQLLKPYTTSLLVDAIYGILINANMSVVSAKDKKQARDELLLLIQDFMMGVMTESARDKLLTKALPSMKV